VKIWFQNRRNKWKRQVSAEMEAARAVRQPTIAAVVHRAATIHTRPASLQFLNAAPTAASNARDHTQDTNAFNASGSGVEQAVAALKAAAGGTLDLLTATALMKASNS
jgi:hypothetical protein